MIAARLAGAALAFDTPGVAAFTLTAGEFTATTLPVEIGELSEAMALSAKRRLHHAGDGGELTVETGNFIPFGAEPEIRRNVRLSEGLLRVTMDLVMRASCPLTRLDAGGVRLEGDFQRAGWIKPPATGCGTPAPEMADFDAFDADGGVIYDSPRPPLGVILESKHERFDWMAGGDLWRWTNAERLGGGHARFTVTREHACVVLRWCLFDRDPVKPGETDQPLPGRNWRLTWAAAWKPLAPARRQVPAHFCDLMTRTWPQSALAYASPRSVNPAANPDHTDDSVPVRPCLCAPAAAAILKKWVRTRLEGAHARDVFAVTNVLPVCCVNAAHVDRARSRVLPHWDLMAVIEFRRWANRALARRGASLRILAPEQSPLRGFMVLE